MARVIALWGGNCQVLTTDDCFGFKPNRASTNWFVKVGDEDNHVIVAGCQIHYAVRSIYRPKDAYTDIKYKDKNWGDIERSASKIYIASSEEE